MKLPCRREMILESSLFALNEDACKQVMWISMVYCFVLACIVRIFQIRVSKGFMAFD